MVNFQVVYLSTEADFKWRYSFIFGNETTSANEERTYRWEQDGWTQCSMVSKIYLNLLLTL